MNQFHKQIFSNVLGFLVLPLSILVAGCAPQPVSIDSPVPSPTDSFELKKVQESTRINADEVFTFLCEMITQKPDSETPNCADFGEAVFEIKWSKWTALGAEGEGVYSKNDCDPDCASGTRSKIPVIVNLNDLYTDGSRYYLRYFSYKAKNAEGKDSLLPGEWDVADFYINVPEMRSKS